MSKEDWSTLGGDFKIDSDHCAGCGQNLDTYEGIEIKTLSQHRSLAGDPEKTLARLCNRCEDSVKTHLTFRRSTQEQLRAQEGLDQ